MEKLHSLEITSAMHEEKLHCLLKALVSELRDNHQMHLMHLANQLTDVVCSELFQTCHTILRLLQTPDDQEELNELLFKMTGIPLQKSASLASASIPPLSLAQLRIRIDQLNLSPETEIHTITLPECHDINRELTFSRSGIILRQAIENGEVVSLYVSGIEKMSPASRADNLKSGDRLLAISGYPLDWRTMDQLHNGLLEADTNLVGLPYNANLHEFASHLLEKPYRMKAKSHWGLKDTTPVTSTPTLIIARRPGCEPKNVSIIRVEDEASKKHSESKDSQCEYLETIFSTEFPSNGLGLQLVADEAKTSNRKTVTISKVLDDSQAEKDGILRKGDRIVEVNYQDITHYPPKEALKKIKTVFNNSAFVQLRAARDISDLDDRYPSASGTNQTPEHKTISPAPDVGRIDLSELEDADKTISTSLSRGKSNELIKVFFDDKWPIQDRRTPLAKPSVEERLAFWRGQLSAGVRLLASRYNTDGSVCGLGISVESTLEQDESTSQTCSHHYLHQLESNGPLGMRGVLMPGDELLELNGRVVFGIDDMTVARTLRSIPKEGYVICARPVTKDQSQDNETIDESEDSSSDVVTMQRIVVPSDIGLAKSPASFSSGEACALSTIAEEQLLADKTCDQHVTEGSSRSSEAYSSDVDKQPQQNILVLLHRSGLRDGTPCEVVQTPITSSVVEDGTKTSPTSTPESNYLPTFQNQRPASSSRSLLEEQSVLTDGGGGSIDRLPMPAKIVPLTPQSSLRRTSLIYESDDLLSVGFDAYEQSMYCTVNKDVGQSLGIEVANNCSTQFGCKLLHIDDESQVGQQLLDGCMKINSSDIHVDDVKPHVNGPPRPGDWISRIDSFTLRNQSSSKIRWWLTRMVMIGGPVKIYYIPAEWNDRET